MIVMPILFIVLTLATLFSIVLVARLVFLADINNLEAKQINFTAGWILAQTVGWSIFVFLVLKKLGVF
ncbi:MAG: hypothetical protein ACE5HO_19355 [bacterium]